MKNQRRGRGDDGGRRGRDLGIWGFGEKTMHALIEARGIDQPPDDDGQPGTQKKQRSEDATHSPSLFHRRPDRFSETCQVCRVSANGRGFPRPHGTQARSFNSRARHHARSNSDARESCDRDSARAYGVSRAAASAGSCSSESRQRMDGALRWFPVMTKGPRFGPKQFASSPEVR